VSESSIAEAIDALRESFADATYRRLLRDACVLFADRRVLDAVLALLFARLAEQPMIAESTTDDEWLLTSGLDNGRVDPPMFTGLPMRMTWDFYGAELFPDGRWDTDTWLLMMGYKPYEL